MQRRLAAEHVEGVFPREPVARPRDRRRADGTVREPECDHRRVLDVATLACTLCEGIRSGGGLHRDDLAGDGTLEVDAVARALEQVAAALRAVQEPRTALRRARADSDQEPELLAVERLAQVVEHLDRAPLIADGTYCSALFRRLHDRRRIVEAARDRFLEIDVDPALQRLDGGLTVQPARRSGPL